MQRRIHNVPLLLVLFYCTSCATPNVAEDYRFQAKQLTGIVVLAVGWYEPSKTLRTWHNEDVSQLHLHFRHLTTDHEQHFELGRPGSKYRLTPTKVQAGRSRLVVAELPTGTYEIDRWSIATTDNGEIEPTQMIPIRFTVEAGLPIYLGAYLVEVLRDKGILNTTNITHAALRIRDENIRDHFYLKKFFPTIATKPLLNRVPQLRYHPSPISISHEPYDDDEDEEDD